MYSLGKKQLTNVPDPMFEKEKEMRKRRIREREKGNMQRQRSS